MTDETAMTLYTGVTQAITTPAPDPRPVWSVDLAIRQWLDAKQKRTQSTRTRDAYQETVQEFRAALQSQGLDLDSVQAQDDKVSMQITRDQVKQIAQLFAGFSKRGRQVKQATIQHRYSVISSFYAFCIKQEWLDYNPIDHLERVKVQPYADVKALDFDDVAAMFDLYWLLGISVLKIRKETCIQEP
jgi:site-specific recombinase XerD